MTNFIAPSHFKTVHMQDEQWLIDYPQLVCSNKPMIATTLNNHLLMQTKQLIKEQFSLQQTKDFTELISSYELKTNERNLISVTQSNYAIFYQAAHGLTLMKAVTADTSTGEIYTLADLFTEGSDYVTVLSEHVKQQITSRNLPTLAPFTRIKPDQTFYITDKNLILFFQLYEITPYYVGIPVFPISIFDLEPILSQTGPFNRLLVT